MTEQKIIYDCCANPAIKIENLGTTCVDYPPIYDKYGNNINPDRNTTTYHYECGNCGKTWDEVK